ncbi:MAG: NUDIX domain-containing protein [Flavobacteriales bacterium]
MIQKFNIRVYFLLIENGCVLVADEIIKGNSYTKFPGGGLEFGEGTIDCVIREAQEELGQEVEVISHFYTTDFFLKSAFDPLQQVVSVYYSVSLIGEQKFITTSKRFDFSQTTDDEESFRWVKLEMMKEEEFSFAADKVVVNMLLKG